MRRSLWGVILVLAAWGPARAELVCEQPIAAVGTLKAGSPLAHRFTFTNKGTGTVELTGFKTSCGCFRPELPKRLLAPGESATLDLHGNTLAQPPGPQSWSVRLGYREAGQDRELVFEVRATLVVEVGVVPPQLSLNTADVLAHDLTLRDLRATPLDLTGVQTTAPGLRARFGEPRRVPEGGWARTITVEVGADYPVGRRDEVLVLNSRDPDYPELRIPITVVKRPRKGALLSPSRVVVVGTPGEALPARLVQLGDESHPAEVERVEPLHPAVTCTWAGSPGAATTLKVRIDGSKVPAEGLDSGVRIFTKGASEPLLLPVRVEWRRP